MIAEKTEMNLTNAGKEAIVVTEVVKEATAIRAIDTGIMTENADEIEKETEDITAAGTMAMTVGIAVAIETVIGIGMTRIVIVGVSAGMISMAQSGTTKKESSERGLKSLTTSLRLLLDCRLLHHLEIVLVRFGRVTDEGAIGLLLTLGTNLMTQGTEGFLSGRSTMKTASVRGAHLHLVFGMSFMYSTHTVTYRYLGELHLHMKNRTILTNPKKMTPKHDLFLYRNLLHA